MKIGSMRLVDIRCFEDTDNLSFSSKCNLFVGANNAGKSTLLRAILALQHPLLEEADLRPRQNSTSAFLRLRLDDVTSEDVMSVHADGNSCLNVEVIHRGSLPDAPNIARLGPKNNLFDPYRPGHTIVPFSARRKVSSFSPDVSSDAQAHLTGTLGALNARIDSVATPGPGHKKFRKATKEIVGIEITTKPVKGGKEAGFYLDDENFVTLQRMGDGVSEMVALIVELCTQKNKIFLLEEPETNIHPNGLKALLAMIREASHNNQFFIATHSNIVVRELAGHGDTKVFRVFRDSKNPAEPSQVEEVPRTTAAHVELMRELGYQFGDFNLHDAWLFLEEASAESVINKVLIPLFVPVLKDRLRTYSAGGVTNLEPSVADFERLFVFIHLQPAYKNRIWICADGDPAGKEAIQGIHLKFPHLEEESLKIFQKEDFESYYPAIFHEEVTEALTITDKKLKRDRKKSLLQKVLEWSQENEDQAREAWSTSAREVIELLRSIASKITVTS